MPLGAAILNFLFNRLYAELAWSYDLVSWVVSGGRWRDWQRQALPFLRGAEVLEIGCGTGHLLPEIRERGYRAVGLDRSPAMWRRAGRRGAAVGADARALPFAANRFDSILLTFPAPYVGGVAFWAEVARTLRLGGRVVILEAAASETRLWPGQLERIVNWLSGGRRAAAGEAVTPPVPGFRAQRILRGGPWGTVSLVVAERLDRQEPG